MWLMGVVCIRYWYGGRGYNDGNRTVSIHAGEFEEGGTWILEHRLWWGFLGGEGGIKITFFKYCLSIYQVPKKSVCSRQCKLTRFQGVSHSIGTIFKLSLLLPIIRLACLYLKTPIIKLERYSRNTSNLRYSVGTTRVDSTIAYFVCWIR